MADTNALKNRIRAAIKANDNQEITGPVLQQSLLDIVDELNGATETEAQQRQNGDSTLQQGINTERQARIDADNALGQRITQEAQAREEAFDDLDMIDAAGSQVAPNAIDLILRKNDGPEEDPEWRTLCHLLIPSVTTERAGLMSVAMRNLLYNLRNAGYAFGGIAVTSTNPGVPTANCFYIVRGAGTYNHFKNADNESIVLENDGIYVFTYDSVENNYWEWNRIIAIDSNLILGSDKIINSDGIIKGLLDISVPVFTDTKAGSWTYTDLYTLQIDRFYKIKVTLSSTLASDFTIRAYYDDGTTQTGRGAIAKIPAGETSITIYYSPTDIVNCFRNGGEIISGITATYEVYSYTEIFGLLQQAAAEGGVFKSGEKVKDVYIENSGITDNSTKLAKSGDVYTILGKNITEYDVSGNHINPTEDEEDPGYGTNKFTLAQALLVVPAKFKKGSLIIRYIDSTTDDVTRRIGPTNYFTTDASQWFPLDVQTWGNSKKGYISQAYLSALIGYNEIPSFGVGYNYPAGLIIRNTNEGKIYRFLVNHSSGQWDSNEVEDVTFYNIFNTDIIKLKENNVSEADSKNKLIKFNFKYRNYNPSTGYGDYNPSRMASEAVDVNNKMFAISINNPYDLLVYSSSDNGLTYSLLKNATNEAKVQIQNVDHIIIVIVNHDYASAIVSENVCITEYFSDSDISLEESKENLKLNAPIEYDVISDFGFKQRVFRNATKIYEASETRVSSDIINIKNKHLKFRTTNGQLLVYISTDNGESYSIYSNPAGGSYYNSSQYVDIESADYMVIMAQQLNTNAIITVDDFEIIQEYLAEIPSKHYVDENVEPIQISLQTSDYYQISNFGWAARNFDRTNGNYKNIGSKTRVASDKLVIPANANISLDVIETTYNIVYAYSTDNGSTWSQFVSIGSGRFEVSTTQETIFVFIVSRDGNAELTPDSFTINQYKYKNPLVEEDTKEQIYDCLDSTLPVTYDVLRNITLRNVSPIGNTATFQPSSSRVCSTIVDITGKTLNWKFGGGAWGYYYSDDQETWTYQGCVANVYNEISNKKYVFFIFYGTPVNSTIYAFDVKIYQSRYKVVTPLDRTITLENRVEQIAYGASGGGGEDKKVLHGNMLTELDLYNPYENMGGTVKLRGQMHCHTTNSDGDYSPLELAQMYLEAGFDFMTITDHDYYIINPTLHPVQITPNPNVAGMVWLGNSFEDSVYSLEGTFRSSLQHTNVYVTDHLFPGKATPDPDHLNNIDINDVLDEYAVNGNSYCCFCHFNWHSLYQTNHKIVSTEKALNFCEVWNGTMSSETRNPEAEYGQENNWANCARGWDILLANGHKVFALAVDDCHGDSSFLRGYVEVYSKSRNPEDIWDALVKGRFVSCNGNHALNPIQITSISVDGGCIRVSTASPCDIYFFGECAYTASEEYPENDTYTPNQLQVNTNVQEAVYRIVGNEKYVRCAIKSGYNYKWLQPIIIKNATSKKSYLL